MWNASDSCAMHFRGRDRQVFWDKVHGRSVFFAKKWPSANYPVVLYLLFIDRPEPVCTTQNEQRNTGQGFRGGAQFLHRELTVRVVRCNYEFWLKKKTK